MLMMPVEAVAVLQQVPDDQDIETKDDQ